MTRRWPLLVIGASAGVAIWSGWVGLGGLTGFGVVKPLPGISDAQINTAIALPVGVEAYAAYALAVATSSGTLAGGTRRFAWRSAWAALGLGMVGQTAFHLMVEAKITTAPWWITTLVSCMPVAVLGMAAYLWHLTARPGEAIGSDGLAGEAPSTQPDGSDGSSQPVAERMDGSEPIGSDGSGDAEADGSDRVVPLHSVGSRVDEQADTTAGTPARPEDLERARAAIEAGDLSRPLTADAIKDTLKIGLRHARAVRDSLNSEPDEASAEG